MNKKSIPRRKSIKLTDRLVESALALAANDALETHRLAGVPLVVWSDGKVLLVSPDTFSPEPTAAGPRSRSTKRRR